MMTIFSEYLQKFMAIFVDNFAVYSSKEKHLEYLRLMFEKCRETSVRLNPYKCLFGAFREVLLGHVVSKNGIEMAQDKIKGIQEALPPTNANETSSFLGYVNFYRRFVIKLVELANPLYVLTKKEATFIWDSKCQEGFENIKEIISKKPILKQPRRDVIFHVHVDASGIALGAILAQPGGEVDFPIYFASRRFSQAEQVYTTTEREALDAATSNVDNLDYIISMIAKSTTMKDPPDVDTSFRVEGQVPCASNIEDQEDKNMEFFVLNTGEDTKIIIGKFESPQENSDAYADASGDTSCASGAIGAGGASEDIEIIIEKSKPPEDAGGDASCASGAVDAGGASEYMKIIIENSKPPPQENGDAFVM
ncbi:hypothetical protein L7F22_016539 [Adiantum nelumboides]|nr:hypothetical protein [Adiantum nelumboides]